MRYTLLRRSESSIKEEEKKKKPVPNRYNICCFSFIDGGSIKEGLLLSVPQVLPGTATGRSSHPL